MFDVGFAELFLLSVIGLLVLGPERLPAVARTLGGLVRKARASWYSLRRQIETELEAADVTAPMKEASDELNRASRQFAETMKDPLSSLGGNAEKTIAPTHNEAGDKAQVSSGTPSEDAGTNAGEDSAPAEGKNG